MSPDLEVIRFSLREIPATFEWDGELRQLRQLRIEKITGDRYKMLLDLVEPAIQEQAGNHIPAAQSIRRAMVRLGFSIAEMETIPPVEEQIPTDAEA